MVDAKTIDNLPPEVNRRFIEDTKLLSEEDVKKVFQTPSIATRAEVLKTAPETTKLDMLFGLEKIETSPFAAPDNFVLATNIFTYQLIPNFGPINEIIEKLESIEEKKKKRKKEEEEAEEERQRKRLLKFAFLMDTLNSILTDIKKRKDEYHKG
ncbi:MAG: hypothetical protein KR126chlam6_01582 [Candidatus Anoxychlamydiales bacterium]|nr:hypothetical protein [Candidatus Anoxychlamydiales bacterium]